VNKILAAEELAIIHGPAGTGKDHDPGAGHRALIARDHQQVLSLPQKYRSRLLVKNYRMKA